MANIVVDVVTNKIKANELYVNAVCVVLCFAPATIFACFYRLALFPRCEKKFSRQILDISAKKYFGWHQFSSKWQQSLLCGSERDTPTALFPSFVSNDTNTENVSWFLAPKVLKIFL